MTEEDFRNLKEGDIIFTPLITSEGINFHSSYGEPMYIKHTVVAIKHNYIKGKFPNLRMYFGKAYKSEIEAAMQTLHNDATIRKMVAYAMMQEMLPECVRHAEERLLGVPAKSMGD